MAESNPGREPFRLIVLDPGHFHASLVQKFMYPDVDPLVHVYAPAGNELDAYLRQVERFNQRDSEPTRWRSRVYSGTDYLQRMLDERAGNLVVLSGNNARKADYVLKSVQAGLNVLADKPMVITPAEMPKLLQAFGIAAEKRVLLYDIMTERFEITTILQRELSRNADLFGELVGGAPDDPSIFKQSVHHFAKMVAGAPLRRPAWFFDVSQQGEGIVDVMTHLVDMVQWAAFPEQPLDSGDVEVVRAGRSATTLTAEQFRNVTGAAPPADPMRVFSNGEFTYRLRGIHASVSVIWNYEAPPGGGDTHFSLMRGTRANLIIRQGPRQGFKPVLYVRKPPELREEPSQGAIEAAIAPLRVRYPGIGFAREDDAWRITIPASYEVGHEAHFSQVTANFLQYLRENRLPAWEVPNMITKYATIMKAYEMSR